MDTILLVDDNPLRAYMRKSVLEGTVPSVVRALDASEALCMVETPEFAQTLVLVVTGHSLKGISGPEFVAELHGRMPHTPVLVVSSSPKFEGEYDGIEGVYFSEAKTPEELRTVVSRLVSVREKQTA